MANRGLEKETRLSPIPRSRLHNFSFLTSSWGHQRIMRRADSRHVTPSSSPSPGQSPPQNTKAQNPTQNPPKEEENSSEKQKPKNREPAKQKPHEKSSEKEEKSGEKEEKSGEKLGENLEGEMRWNLRKRRANGKGDSSDEKEEKKRKPFSVALSYEEIEADFMIMKGKKPPRRPKKRAKHVQRQIDMVFPGMWLTEVTPDLYKVKED